MYGNYVKNPKVIVTGVVNNSPAKTAGLETNDEVLEFKTKTSFADMKSATSVIEFVKKNNDADITIVFKKEKTGETVTSTVRAVYGVTTDRKSVGMGVAYGEKVKLNVWDALSKGVSETAEYTKLTVIGMIDIFSKLFSGENVLSSLSGPVGIAKMAGGASAAGWQSLFSFMALLSINLAVFNALPLPALDGGRFLFVIYESVFRRKINLNFQYYANLIGFLFLIGLMLTVTFFDIFR
jgi:regulator of sigma E protease